MNWKNLRFAWDKYYPWYFLADVLILAALVAVLFLTRTGVLLWLLK